MKIKGCIELTVSRDLEVGDKVFFKPTDVPLLKGVSTERTGRVVCVTEQTTTVLRDGADAPIILHNKTGCAFAAEHTRYSFAYDAKATFKHHARKLKPRIEGVL